MNPKNLPSCHASTPNTQHLARVVTAESRHLLVHLPPVVTMATTARKVCYPCNRGPDPCKAKCRFPLNSVSFPR